MSDTQSPTKTLSQLKGLIERITFTSEETGYTVAKLKVYGRSDLVTITGNLANPVPGTLLQVSGEWTMHPRFGEQFKVIFYSTLTPATAYGIERYLGSGLIKGIGPIMAKRIVKVFGDKTLEIIDTEAHRLSEVSGIGKARVEMITKAWQEQKAIREVMLFLQGNGVSATYATKIYKEYGDAAISIVQKNPYRLARDIFGIGFLTADKIAEKMGFAKDSPERAEAGILYTLHTASDDGHVCLPLKELSERSTELLEVEQSLLESAISSLSADEDIVIDDINNPMVYLAKYYLCEVRSAEMLIALSKSRRHIRPIQGEVALSWVEERLGITLAAKQKEAVLTCAMNNVSVITGGPGTGKTTIIRAILKIFASVTKKILLAAPTGRAAKRMSEATGFEAKTIHRLLEYNMAKGGFAKNSDTPLEADIVIIDEASMLDLILSYHLLKAIPQGAMLIFVGDIDQLPAVGAGSVLKDIIESGKIPVTKLNEIFRQAQTSDIVTNAHKIIRGEMPHFSSTTQGDFFFFQAESPEEVQACLIDVVTKRIPRSFHLNAVTDIQVLTPMNRGEVGTQNLNLCLQEALNPKKYAEMQRGSKVFRVGDKVMQIRNNYDKNVYNGDIGFVTRLDTEQHTLFVSIDGNEVCYESSELDEIVLAYAVSVHKSQGSEYPAVVIPITTQHFMMLQRNLIYTGITRGKKLVVLIGTKKAIGIAVRNEQITHRYGRLKKRIQVQ